MLKYVGFINTFLNFFAKVCIELNFKNLILKISETKCSLQYMVLNFLRDMNQRMTLIWDQQ